PMVVEQAAILDAFNPGHLASDAEALQVAQFIARRLNGLTPEAERGWEGTVQDGGFVFTRRLRGVTERHTIDAALMRSADARRLVEMAGELQRIYGRPALLKSKEREI